MPSALAWAECERREMVWTTASNRAPLKSSSGSNIDSRGHSNTWVMVVVVVEWWWWWWWCVGRVARWWSGLYVVMSVCCV